jgi:lipoprotein-anchoring transpeptidase ErfK/SrfK
MNKFKIIIFMTPFFLLLGVSYWYYKELQSIKNANFIIINKTEMTLSQYNYKGELQLKFNVATGKNYGNKIKQGDSKTPEGVFTINEIVDASTWSHDFKDGLGTIEGAYGPNFIRLNIPNQKGIGIHGTHDNSSIGKRISEGCIRLNNNDLIKLVNNIKNNAVVVITPSIEDVKFNTNPNLVNNSDLEKALKKVVVKKNNPLKEGKKIIIK